MEQSNSFSKTVGMPPGSLIHIGKGVNETVKITYIEFAPNHFVEKDLISVEDIPEKSHPEAVVWINIDGLGNSEIIRMIGEKYKMHQLLLEDILNTYHRPKFEEYDQHVFATLKMIGLGIDSVDNIVKEQISIVHGEGWVISFQEKEGDVFDPLRNRLRDNYRLVRTRSANYIFYRLIDLIVDNYFYVTEHLEEHIDELEAEVMANPDKEARISIQKLKTNISSFRKGVNPLREAIIQALKSDHSLMKNGTEIYIKDVYDHLVHILDNIDNQKDQLSNILDLFLSGISFKMNQIMQVLTIIATIFIPLTFIAGIYGMNFTNMPELSWKYGYFGALGFMFIVLVGMLLFFRNKKWL